MERTFRIKLANAAREWAEVLEQDSLHQIVDRLSTRRSWQVEEFVEAGEAGWVAGAKQGNTSYALSMTVPAEAAKAPPPPIIEWTLVAGASRDDSGQLRVPLAAFMFGTGLLFTVLGIHFGLRPILIPILAVLGIFPVGLLLGIVALQPLANRRSRAPVTGGAEFLNDVAAVVDQLQAAR
jgi:hypothetical protein